MFLAGLDIGTSNCKISVYHDTGDYLGDIRQNYPVLRTQLQQEIDPTAIWLAVCNILKKAAQQFPPVSSIGVTSFGETFVLLDKENQPLYPALLYTDPRGEEECHYLTNALSAQRINKITGLNPHHMYSLPKLMWIKNHLPDLYSRIHRVFLIEDYIVYMLTGTRQIDYSLATRTMGFDIQTLTWSKELFAAAGILPELFSVPVPIGTDAGILLPDIADELGLPPKTHIVSVSHDQTAAAIGCGAFDEHTAVNGSGTVECITPVFSHINTASMSQGNYNIIPYISADKYVCYAFLYTGGALIEWFIKNLAGHVVQRAAETGTDIYCELESGCRTGSSGLLVLPHFAGAATPYMDVNSKGAIIGLTLAHTQEDIYLALLEGICYEMRLNMEFLHKAGVIISSLRATGGGAHSQLWLQMKADILNVPVTVLQSSEAGTIGSAMLAGIAAGIYSDLDTAASAMVRPEKTYMPRPAMHKQYEKYYNRYKKLYKALQPFND